MSLAALAECCPTWADFRSINAREAAVDLVAVRTSETFTRLFELRILHLGDAVTVSEREIGSTLPPCCPERHINPDGSFCTGLRAGEGITAETAPAWWDKLHAFALCQETAAETGFWPSEAQLSHGEAGKVELVAENAADQLGLRAVYREAVAFDSGLIASGLRKINAKTGTMRNGRSVCVCGRTDRRGRILLRRDCHRSGLGCPIVFEHRRRVLVEEYWRSLRGHVTCCGTMQACPLGKTGDGARPTTTAPGTMT
jgi:E2 ubiquitin ligase family protein